MYSELIALILCLLTNLVTSCHPVVQTKYGTLRGLTSAIEGRPVDIFLGVPFAEPPTGKNRFLKPQPLESVWNSTFLATKQPNACPQPQWGKPIETSEDCLYLNIWRPKILNNIPKPVLVYFYGGAFREGSISTKQHNGSLLAARGDIIVVTANYRLGPLGFLYGNDEDAPGNMALWDQNLALKWIKENIENFGGDPEQVTLSGESAGAMTGSIHIMSQFSKNLFHKAIIMSGAAMNGIVSTSKDYALRKAVSLATVVGCRQNKDKSPLTKQEVECLKAIDANTLISVQNHPLIINESGQIDYTPFRPIYGDTFAPLSPREAIALNAFSSNLSILLGNVLNEGSVMRAMAAGFEERKPKTKEEWMASTINNFNNKAFGYPSISGKVIKELFFADVEEGDLHGLQKAQENALGTVMFDCPTNFFAEHLATKNEVYQYVFAYASKKGTEPSHGQDVHYTFGTLLDSKEEEKVSLKWMHFLFRFIKSEKMPLTRYNEVGQRTISPFYLFTGSNENKVFHGYKYYQCLFWKDAITSLP